MTIKQLSEVSGLSTSAIRSRIRSGEIAAHKMGNLYLVAKSAMKHRRHMKPPKEKSELIQPEIARVFANFAAEHRLSCAGLADVFGVSRTSDHRLMKGTVTEDFFTKIKDSLPPEIVESLNAPSPLPARPLQTP